MYLGICSLCRAILLVGSSILPTPLRHPIQTLGYGSDTWLQFDLELDYSLRGHSRQILRKHVQKFTDYMDFFKFLLYHVM
jgi:hypothetical protein